MNWPMLFWTFAAGFFGILAFFALVLAVVTAGEEYGPLAGIVTFAAAVGIVAAVFAGLAL